MAAQTASRTQKGKKTAMKKSRARPAAKKTVQIRGIGEEGGRRYNWDHRGT